MFRRLEIGHDHVSQSACRGYMHTLPSIATYNIPMWRKCMDWSPTLADRQGPVYRRIVEALSDDIASGRLHRGQQLPTHRALARALGVDLTTVTRAYTEARRAGLTEARAGQGTFVAESIAHMRHASRPLDEF